MKYFLSNNWILDIQKNSIHEKKNERFFYKRSNHSHFFLLPLQVTAKCALSQQCFHNNFFLFILASTVLSPPHATIEKQFLLSDGRIALEARLDRAVYAHGDSITVDVNVTNNSSKSVKRIEVNEDAPTHTHTNPCISSHNVLFVIIHSHLYLYVTWIYFIFKHKSIKFDRIKPWNFN